MGQERDRLIRRLGETPLSDEDPSHAEIMAGRMARYAREGRLPPEIEALREWPLVVGYGTLLSRASVARTVGEGVEERPFLPVVVPGFKRLFNLRPEHYEPSFRLSPDPVEVAAANVQPCPGASFNGLAFRVAPQELPALDERERYYQRVRVPLHDFPEGETLGEAFVYSAGKDSPWVEGEGSDLLPRWKDLLLARSGAFQVSEAFGKAFDETTFLADGSTRVRDRYARHLSLLSTVPSHPPPSSPGEESP